VDDNPNNLTVIGTFLKKEGYDVRLAQSGRAALESANASTPDLIILDVSMPGMDGYETCTLLRQNPALHLVPILFLTAERKGTDSLLEGFRVGASDYIEKPVESAVIAARVRLHLDLHRSRRELERRNQELSALNDWKTRLIGILGHDLRNPISGFCGLTEIMLQIFDDYSRETLKDHVQELHRTAVNTSAILENILAWASASEGRAAKVEAITVTTLLDELCPLFEASVGTKGIHLDITAVPPLLVLADSDMTNTILRNFVTNAVKFTGPGGTISIEVREDQEAAELRVVDTGMGIAPDRLPRLFSRDMGSTRGTAGEKGSGLGLLICRELAERQGGSVGAESELGRGSVFFLRLPKAGRSAL
jgi:signal transduction histidine kinase